MHLLKTEEVYFFNMSENTKKFIFMKRREYYTSIYARIWLKIQIDFIFKEKFYIYPEIKCFIMSKGKSSKPIPIFKIFTTIY